MSVIVPIFNVEEYLDFCVESLVNHCYSQSHSGVPHEVKTAAGIKIGLLRFSVGVEDIEDIWADISQALDTTL